MSSVEDRCDLKKWGCWWWISSRSGWLLELLTELKMAMYCPQGSGTLRQQLLMMHGIALYCMVLHGILLYCDVLHGIARYCMVLHGIAWYCMVLHGIAPSCTNLHHLAPPCTILHHLAPSCNILHHLAPSCTILHLLAPSCTILHYLAVLSCCTHKVFMSQQISRLIALDIHSCSGSESESPVLRTGVI